ncbi:MULTISPECIES: cation:proton antiporter [Campylobacter]|uniref:cation:proton antiporter n=1 Tax=Campylobacter TaxID=194 RepID=UPI000A32E3BF|nr:cation:proton antiporter [Campylobacter sp. P0124]MCR8695686.1 cation:proton antiporter [Campylobacter sp. RM19073]
MDNLVYIFIIAAGCAILFNLIFRKYEIPTIIGYIATGVFISQLFGLKSNHDLSFVAEFGIVFLMFTIGLEFSIKHLMSMKKYVFLYGSIQMIVTGFILSLLAFYMFGLDIKIAIIIGFAMALSSTAIVLKILNDTGHISKKYGRKALGILLFQDIAVIPLLLMMDIFDIKDGSVSSLILTSIISAVILIVLLYFIGKYILSRVLNAVIQTNSKEIFITTILFTVIGASFLAHYFGFSYSLGAFIAGMLIAETPYKHQIETDLIPFRDLLLGLFFITVGMQINFAVIFTNLLIIIPMLICVLFIKIMVVYLFLMMFARKKTALKTALSLAQVGEFALAIFTLLSVKNMIDDRILQILTAVVIISMVLTPFILKNVVKIADKMEEQDILDDEIISSQEQDIMDELTSKNSMELKEHFVVCGYGRLGREIIRQLKAKGCSYIALESDLNLVERGKKSGDNVYYGDATQSSTLQKVCIKDCVAAIIAVSNEQKSELIANSIKDLGYDVNTIIRFADTIEKGLYRDFGDHFHLVKEREAVANAIIRKALECVKDKFSRSVDG